MKDRYDTFWPRFAAGLWDGLIFLLLRFISPFIHDNAATQTLIIWDIFYVLSRPVYTIWMHGKFGQTVGKIATGVIVLNSDETRIISYKEAVIRESPYIIIILVYLVLLICYLLNGKSMTSQTAVLFSILGYAYWIWYLLEIITMFSNNKRRALHDLIAHSVIIRKDFIQSENISSP